MGVFEHLYRAGREATKTQSHHLYCVGGGTKINNNLKVGCECYKFEYDSWILGRKTGRGEGVVSACRLIPHWIRYCTEHLIGMQNDVVVQLQIVAELRVVSSHLRSLRNVDVDLRGSN